MSHCPNCTAHNALFYTAQLTLNVYCSQLCRDTAQHAHFTAKTTMHKLHCTHCTVHPALLILYTTVVLHAKLYCYNNAKVDFTVQISSLSYCMCAMHGPSRLA